MILSLMVSSYGWFTLHRTGTGTRAGKWWVPMLSYVLYTLHGDREPLFSVMPILVPVQFPVPCSVYKPLRPSARVVSFLFLHGTFTVSCKAYNNWKQKKNDKRSKFWVVAKEDIKPYKVLRLQLLPRFVIFKSRNIRAKMEDWKSQIKRESL